MTAMVIEDTLALSYTCQKHFIGEEGNGFQLKICNDDQIINLTGDTIMKKILIGLALVFALSAQCFADHPSFESSNITGTWKGSFEGENADKYVVVVKFTQTDSNVKGSYRAKNKGTGSISKGTLKGTLNENVEDYYLKFLGKQTDPCKGRITKGGGGVQAISLGNDTLDYIDLSLWLKDCKGKEYFTGYLRRQGSY